MAIDQATLGRERSEAPSLFPPPPGSHEAFAVDRSTCFGWREETDGNASYLLQRYGWTGRWQVAGQWPATAEGWDAAWRYLSVEQPTLTEAISAALAPPESPGSSSLGTGANGRSGAIPGDDGSPAQTWQPIWFRQLLKTPGLEYTLGVLVATRALVWIASLLGLWLIGTPDQPTPFHVGAATNLFAVSARWDSLWYLQIAQHGYSTAMSTNFYPLFPLLIHIFTWVFRVPVLAGLAVTWICALIAGVLLYQLVALDFGETVARRSVLLLYLSPIAVFFTAVYTESLFLVLSIGCVYAARRERWWVAGTLAALASATRPPGILLVLPLAVLFFYGPRPNVTRLSGPRATRLGQRAGRVRGWLPRYGWSSSALAIALGGGGLLVYLAYCALHVQDFFEPFHVAEIYWGHYATFPLGGLWHAVMTAPSNLSDLLHGVGLHITPTDAITWTGHELIDLAFVIPVVYLLFRGTRGLPFAYTAYAGANVLLVLSTPSHLELLESSFRYTLILFPLYITAARRWMNGPVSRAVTLSTSTALLCFVAAWFGAGKWVA